MNNKQVLSQFTILCWASFTAILGHVLDSPARVSQLFMEACFLKSCKLNRDLDKLSSQRTPQMELELVDCYFPAKKNYLYPITILSNVTDHLCLLLKNSKSKPKKITEEQ